MRPLKFKRKWDSLDREAIREWQGALLSRYLRRTVLPHSKYYSSLFREQGITPESIRKVEDLQRIPFTRKEDLLPTPENSRKYLDFALIPDARKLRRQKDVILKALYKGRKRVKEELEREFRPIFMTSTTSRSAEPIPFLYTQCDLRNLARDGARIAEIGRTERDDRLLNMFPYAPHLAYWLTHFLALEENLFCVGTGGGKTIGTEGNIRLIKRLNPTMLVGMPTFLYHVLQQAREENKRFEGINKIVLGGEKVTAGTRTRLQELCEQLGSPDVTVVATYGFTEAKMAWVECPFPIDEKSGGYHLYPDLGIFEIIDPESGEVLPEGEGGEIVFTPLNARGTVVIRYRTGDHVEGGMVYEPCPYCGRQVPRLIGRITRVSDVHSMQLQKLKGTLVDFNVLEHLLDDMEQVASWKLEIRKVRDDPMELDELVLHVCKGTPVSEEVLTHEINTRFANAVEIRPTRIEFHTHKEMRRLHRVGEVLKEEKIVDQRVPIEEPEIDWNPPHWNPAQFVFSTVRRMFEKTRSWSFARRSKEKSSKNVKT